MTQDWIQEIKDSAYVEDWGTFQDILRLITHIEKITEENAELREYNRITDIKVDELYKKMIEVKDTIHKLRKENAELVEAVEYIRDYATTLLKPDAFGMTSEEWKDHKIQKIAHEAVQAIAKARGGVG